MTRNPNQTLSKNPCWAPLILGLAACALALSQHQRTLRHWQKVISSAVRSAEFQSVADQLLANGVATVAAVTFLSILARFSPALRMYRWAHTKPTI